MAKVTQRGNPIELSGDLPALGSGAPDFQLTRNDLKDVGLADFAGKKKVLNIVPSLDTGICAASARAFNQRIGARGDAVVLTISRDLPFAQKRFCEAEGIANVVTLSELRNRDFGRAYGMEIRSGSMTGLLGRAVVVLAADDRVVYTQLVPEIIQEPDYDAALRALS